MADAIDGSFIWYDYITNDAPAALAFYTGICAWKVQPDGPNGHYTMLGNAQGSLGGVVHKGPAEVQHPHWLGNVRVADVAAAVAKAKKLGGRVLKEDFEIPNVGRSAVLADPQGGAIAVFAPTIEVPQRDVTEEGEICWHELLTPNAAEQLAFYGELFGWKVVQAMDMGAMGKYTIYGIGETTLGGMMDVPPGAPPVPTWFFYVDTKDLDAAMARAQARGGKILNGPVRTPGGSRIAQMQDPFGAAFALHQLSKP